MVYSPHTGILLNNELLDLCWRQRQGSGVAPPPGEAWAHPREEARGAGGALAVAPGPAPHLAQPQSVRWCVETEVEGRPWRARGCG